MYMGGKSDADDKKTEKIAILHQRNHQQKKGNWSI